jgi:hypothetical protein
MLAQVAALSSLPACSWMATRRLQHHLRGQVAQQGKLEAHAAAARVASSASAPSCCWPSGASRLISLHLLPGPRFALPLHARLFVRVQLQIDQLRGSQVGARAAASPAAFCICGSSSSEASGRLPSAHSATCDS